MRINTLLALLFLVDVSITPGRVNAQTSTDSSTAGQSSAAPDPPAADDAPDWLFPIAKLDESLPYWLRIGGQYRNRLEAPASIGYAGSRDFYLLDRLRVWVNIQPKDWLRLHGEVQDARIFFNHHIPNVTLTRTVGPSGKATLR